LKTIAKLALLSLFVAFTLTILPAYAEGEVSLPDVPTYIATQLGTSVFIGQLIASAIMFSMVMFPLFILTKSKVAQLMAGMLVLSICVGLGWVPIWIFAITVMMIAFGFANTVGKYAK